MTGSEDKTESIEPFRLNVPQSALDDLARRLEYARLPDPETAEGWSQGVPLAGMRELLAYWRSTYDWRRCETLLNRLGQFRTNINGVGINFLHIRSPHPKALPLILTHGWPGSLLEFRKVIGPLSEPMAPAVADAFHLVIPSLPGYGWSGKPSATGWNIRSIAQAWSILMSRLGYTNYVAQGGDWGAAVTTELGRLRPRGLLGIHLSQPFVTPKEPPNEVLSFEERRARGMVRYYRKFDSGYARQQSTRPQTLGYALTDSPIGQAAWIYEKYREWADCNGDPTTIFSMDEMIDNIMFYWLPAAATSAARLYWEAAAEESPPARLNIPVGCSIFPKDIVRAPRSWAERSFSNIIYWNELDRGGHFAAWEQPELFVQEVRACFRSLR